MSISPRRLAGGKTVYDVRLRTPEGRPYKRTFKTKDEAVKFQATELADRSRGSWVDPSAGRLSINEYADSWLEVRVDLRPRTRELYAGLLRLHIKPFLGSAAVGDLSTAHVRKWYASLQNSSGKSTAAKAYRLLHAILATAVEDEVIVKNPCRLKRAGYEAAKERPIATVEQIAALADAVDRRYRVMILLAAWTGMRFGELAGLTRRHLDLLHMRVSVVQQIQELEDGTTSFAPPKTVAGIRTIAIPPHLAGELAQHLQVWAEPRLDGLVFPSPEGGPLRRSNFNRRVWQPASGATGLEGLRFHDLRHTGNTLAASTGASVKELMARMGHASSRAALIYQHATQERDAEIAAALTRIAERATTRSPGPSTSVKES